MPHLQNKCIDIQQVKTPTSSLVRVIFKQKILQSTSLGEANSHKQIIILAVIPFMILSWIEAEQSSKGRSQD